MYSVCVYIRCVSFEAHKKTEKNLFLSLTPFVITIRGTLLSFVSLLPNGFFWKQVFARMYSPYVKNV
jgi:hypothetical protein